MRTHTQETQKNMTPADALQCLKRGNQRFIGNLRANRDLLRQVNETSDGQFPFAIVLSCIDSRTSAELIFDQGLGDIFSARVAGNIVNDDILGSMEYSCKVAGSKLVMVLGHTKCGAITSACKHVELGNITALLSKIQPAVSKIEACVDDISAPENIELVAVENVKLAIHEIRNRSEILRDLEETGKIIITGGMYNVETGEVDFLD